MDDLTQLRAGDLLRGLCQREVRSVPRQIEKVHERFWMNRRLSAIKWLPSHTFLFSEVDDVISEAFIDEYGRRIGENIVTIVKPVFQQRPAIDQAMTARPFTPIRGDLRVDNLLFYGIEPNPEAVMLDWQNPCLTASVP